jgi:hypothetical protein
VVEIVNFYIFCHRFFRAAKIVFSGYFVGINVILNSILCVLINICGPSVTTRPEAKATDAAKKKGRPRVNGDNIVTI